MREAIASLLLGVRPSAPKNPIRIPQALIRFGAGLWKWKWAILAVTLFLLSVSLMRGWKPFGPSREELRLRAELAREEAQTQAVLGNLRAELAAIGADARVARTRLEALSARGQQEIENARPDNEAPLDADLERAWRASLRRLCEYPDPDGSFAPECGSEP